MHATNITAGTFSTEWITAINPHADFGLLL